MQHKPLWLFSYDIGCPKRLKKAHKLCSEAGWCLQKSVFVMALTPPEKMAFCKKVEKVVDKQQDRLLCLPFSTPAGSFHWGDNTQWPLYHSDERLNGFVF
ncbi:TPA: CRISPR-associated endonuclease Cas2 [Photobacterium damselae]